MCRSYKSPGLLILSPLTLVRKSNVLVTLKYSDLASSIVKQEKSALLFPCNLLVAGSFLVVVHFLMLYLCLF